MRGIKTITISILTLSLLAGSAVGAAAQDDARPVSFSFTVSEGEFIEGTVEEGFGPMTMRDFTDVGAPIVADDDRASGLLTTAFNVDSWPPLGDETFSVTTTSQRLFNEGGSWSGTGTEVRHEAGPDLDVQTLTWMATLTGEGGYEGLTLVLLRDDSEEGKGFILPSVPPVPELPVE